MMHSNLFCSLVILFLVVSCGLDGNRRGGGGSGGGGEADADAGSLEDLGDDDPSMVLEGVPILGDGTHESTDLEITIIAGTGAGLSTPRDLAINPDVEGQIFIVNYGDESVVILHDAHTNDIRAERRKGESSDHFMARPAGIAMGAPGFFATIHETDEVTQFTTPEDFMGPTLWTSNLDIYDAGHGGHMDMLHNSPLGMGIAWDSSNIYWVFDGAHSSLTRYNFNNDHSPGGSDHSDGDVARFVEGEVTRQPLVSAGMEMHHATGMLYVADPAFNRILVLDTESGTRGSSLPFSENYDGTSMYYVDGANLTMLVDGELVDEMQEPSGLAIFDDMIFVADHSTSTILAFDLDGNLLDYLPLDAVGLMGLEIDDEGRIYVVDTDAQRVIRITIR
jgi:DNA-binding beta-propeller fold protein YncE